MDLFWRKDVRANWRTERRDREAVERAERKGDMMCECSEPRLPVYSVYAQIERGCVVDEGSFCSGCWTLSEKWISDIAEQPWW